MTAKAVSVRLRRVGVSNVCEVCLVEVSRLCFNVNF